MTNHIPDREPVPIDKHETPDAALCQLDGRVGAAGTKTNTKYRLVLENSGFKNACAPRGKFRLYISEDRRNGLFGLVKNPKRRCPIRRTIRRDKFGGIGADFLNRIQEHAKPNSFRGKLSASDRNSALHDCGGRQWPERALGERVAFVPVAERARYTTVAEDVGPLLASHALARVATANISASSAVIFSARGACVPSATATMVRFVLS